VYLDGGMNFVVDYFQGRESYFGHVFTGCSPQCVQPEKIRVQLASIESRMFLCELERVLAL
jgi:hypothetical protein